MNKGFTLLETLVTVFIVAMVIAWAVPSLLTLTKLARLEAAAQQSYGLLRMARSDAIKTGQTRYVQWQQEGARWCVQVSKHLNCDCLRSTCEVGAPHLSSDDFPGVTLTHVAFAQGNHTLFDGLRGMTEGHAGRVTFAVADLEQELSVVLSRLGRVRFCQFGGLTRHARC